MAEELLCEGTPANEGTVQALIAAMQNVQIKPEQQAKVRPTDLPARPCTFDELALEHEQGLCLCSYLGVTLTSRISHTARHALMAADRRMEAGI